MGLIKNIWDNLTKEDEQLKAARIEREAKAEEQNRYIKNMKCPICGNHNFNKSRLRSTGAYGGSVNNLISYYRNGESFYNKVYEVNSIMCLNCGYVITFADMTTMSIDNLEH